MGHIMKLKIGETELKADIENIRYGEIRQAVEC